MLVIRKKRGMKMEYLLLSKGKIKMVAFATIFTNH